MRIFGPMAAEITHSQVLANGITFHVATSGAARSDGPAILFIHGFPEGWMSWRPLMQRLTDARTYAVDLRGYPGSARPKDGYDVFTLTDDIAALIDTLGLERPVLVTHDWGGALGWIFAHRYSELIIELVVINCTHPKTLVRAVLHFEDFQTLRIPWVPFFQIPRIAEAFFSTALGRTLLRLTFTLREGRKGAMDLALVDELVQRFQRSIDLRGPIDYYREMVRTLAHRSGRARLDAVYARPITVPTTLIWGLKDRALSSRVARKSEADAGGAVEWRPLDGIGHFVGLEAPDLLADELSRVLSRVE